MQEEVCSPCHFMFTQVRDNELLPVQLVSTLHPRGNDRMTLRRVAADDDDKIGLLHVSDRTRIASVTNGAEQTLGRRGLAVARTIVDVVGADDCPRQLLHEVAFLIRTLRGIDE